MMNNNELLQVQGEIQDIIFRNDDNGYTVISLISDDDLTAVGIMPPVNVGEIVKLTGVFKSHNVYGKQFATNSCEVQMPSSSLSILKYLSSGAIKGIGATTARRLIEVFGEETLSIIENDYERLATVKGVTLARAKSFNEEFNKINGIRILMTSMQKFSIQPQECVRIWKILGDKANELIAQNPYILCDENMGISFKKADAIAISHNLTSNSTFRVRAALIHILTHNKSNGHTCVPRNMLINKCCGFLNIDEETANITLDELIDDKSVTSCFLEQKEFIFLNSLYDGEMYISSRISLCLNFTPQVTDNVHHKISLVEKNDNIKYADLQKEAILKALTTGLLILTGGPGTGKTTTLNAIIKLLKDNGQKVYLAAPTGRAAQRMSEVTGCDAKTIHRLLEVAWDKNDRPTFKRNEKNMLNCDALIIDELSMVDAYLFESLLKSLPLSCRLILVGDTDQLPSVGAGNILHDLINSKLLPVVHLNEVFRQSMKSLIVTNAHSIVSGNYPILDAKTNDFFFLKRFSPSQISQTIVDLYSTRLPKSYGYSSISDIQVLSPSRKGTLGSNEINKQLQLALNPPNKNKKEITVNGTILRVGDKVMQMKNDYDIFWERKSGEKGDGIFNGDIGILIDIHTQTKTLTVMYDDKKAYYNFEAIINLDLAYASTVHKSQGNEYTAVIIPMYKGPDQLYYRNLLYTAVTRAKKILILVGDDSIVYKMVDNNKKTLRYSGLKHFLQKSFTSVSGTAKSE